MKCSKLDLSLETSIVLSVTTPSLLKHYGEKTDLVASTV